MRLGLGIGIGIVRRGVVGPFVPPPAWVINPGDGAIVFVSTPDFPVFPATIIATAGDGLIQFKDI